MRIRVYAYVCIPLYTYPLYALPSISHHARVYYLPSTPKQRGVLLVCARLFAGSHHRYPHTHTYGYPDNEQEPHVHVTTACFSWVGVWCDHASPLMRCTLGVPRPGWMAHPIGGVPVRVVSGGPVSNPCGGW